MLDTLYVTEWAISLCLVCMPLLTSMAGLLPESSAGATLPQYLMLMQLATATTSCSDSLRSVLKS